jgi:hypothetical protein
MRSWFDDTTWDTAQGKQLVVVLAQHFRTEDAAEWHLGNAGLIGLMKFNCGEPRYMWNHIVRNAHGKGQLRRLLQAIVEDPGNGALAERFTELSLPAQPAAGNPHDPYDVVLVGPQQRPLVDRANLRAHVRMLVNDRYPVLVIRDGNTATGELGQPKRCSGKSFSIAFINHAVQDRDIKVAVVDLSHRCTTADHVMQRICRCLGFTDLVTHVAQTTKVKYAEELVDLLQGQLRHNESRLILVIDGLDRTDVEQNVHDFVVHLAERVALDQLPCTQLVLTGYHGDLGPKVGYPLIEDIDPVTEVHVRAFFETLKEGLTPGHALTPAILDEYVREAMTHVGDMEKMELVIRRRALELVSAR